MTGRTHQIVAFGAVVALAEVLLPEPPPAGTVLAMAAAGMLGGLAPDLDKPGSTIWRVMPAGGLLARLVNPLFVGGHRHLSHSLLGLALIGALVRLGMSYLPAAHGLVIEPIWWAFLAGYASHLVADSLNPDGVPWLFPLPWFFGFPPGPLRVLRLPTGGFVERWLLAPALLAGIGLLYYANLDRLATYVR